jgi:serralysin
VDKKAFVACVLGVLAAVTVPTAPARAAEPDPVLALLSDKGWSGTRITYGFPGAGFRWEYSTAFTSGFVPADDTEKALFREALREWAAASGGAVSFVETGPRSAQVRLGVTRSSLGTKPNGDPYRGWTYYPGSSARAGDVWLQAGLRTLGYADGKKGGWVVRHEIGHALGLKHPHAGTPTLPVDLDCAEHTVMTYRTYCGDPAPGGWPDTRRSYPYALGDLDGRAVRLVYAPSASTQAEGSISTRQPDQPRQPVRPQHDAPRGQE